MQEMRRESFFLEFNKRMNDACQRLLDLASPLRDMYGLRMLVVFRGQMTNLTEGACEISGKASGQTRYSGGL